MTTLEAVNQIIASVNEFPFAALDTGGTSVASLAETKLDQHDLRIQSQAWHENTEHNIELAGEDVTKLAMVHADLAWDADEKTLTKTAAFASYTFAGGDQIELTAGTGVTIGWYEIYQKVSDNVIELVESIADDDNADTTSTVIGWEDAIELPSDIIRCDSDRRSSNIDVTLRNGKLFDRDNNTYTFSSSIIIRRVRQLAFADLSVELAGYISASAAREFQTEEVGSATKDRMLFARELSRRSEAFEAESQQGNYNTLQTQDVFRKKGLDVAQRGR